MLWPVPRLQQNISKFVICAVRFLRAVQSTTVKFGTRKLCRTESTIRRPILTTNGSRVALGQLFGLAYLLLRLVRNDCGLLCCVSVV